MVELEDEAYPEIAEGGKLLAPEGKHVAPVYGKSARIRSGQRAKDLQQRRLSSPGSAHNGDDLALRSRKIHPLEHLQGTE